MVMIPPEVSTEFGFELPWLQVREVRDIGVKDTLGTQLGPGESAAIALAMEFRNSALILDDRSARSVARKLGLRLTGTIGILLEAKRSGVLDRIGPVLEDLTAAGFRLSESLTIRALAIAGESPSRDK